MRSTKAAPRALLVEQGLRSAIFLGDDRSDGDVFTVLRELRAAGSDVLLTLSLGLDGPETPALVREPADLLAQIVALVEQPGA